MNKIERYIEAFSAAGTAADNALLDELERATNLRVIQPKMVSGRVQGAFLTLVTRMLSPQTVLEIGTFTGYSALSIAAGLGDGATLHTIEIDDELEDIAREFFDRSPHGGKIRLHIADALEFVPRLVERLGRPFDMVFIDGDKRQYPEYFRMLMGGNGSLPMVGSGSIILSDNVLWYGKVAEAEAKAKTNANADADAGASPRDARPQDLHTTGIVEFNRMVAADPRVENVILPLRDGINLIRVR
jgi:caffeoyl-CoA O-methyltransferase